MFTDKNDAARERLSNFLLVLLANHLTAGVIEGAVAASESRFAEVLWAVNSKPPDYLRAWAEAMTKELLGEEAG